MEALISLLAAELDRPAAHIANVVRLIDEGCTIPFIARYRKEMHGGMDDQLLRKLAERLDYLRRLDARRGEITAAIDGQGKLTGALSAAIDAAGTLSELEDLYRPFRQKRRTRATVAREKGLEPLAALLYAQARDCPAPEAAAADWVDPEKGVETVSDALRGASDIIAEWISDDAAVRSGLRQLWQRQGELRTVAATEADSVYRLYYDFCQPLSRLQDHQILAIDRGEREKLLRVAVRADREAALPLLCRRVVKPGSAAMDLTRAAAGDAYDRLIAPALERELRAALTERAAEGAIAAFARNLEPLLMQPPLKNQVTLGFDPAYRTGCKLAVVDGTGKLLETGVIYPTPPHNKKEEARRSLTAMIRRHGVTAIAIGNGTASRESEIFVAELLREMPGVSYMMVSEAGASVYSASPLGAAEFPDFDVSLRSAVSIARRLQDPLAELVKIDPKSIGVGQYQHDMPQARLDEALRAVVEKCVNAVGVDVNTASPSLLAYVSGLNAATAGNIVAWREANGPFTSRAQLKKVPRIGPKAFEQCAGFLRVPESRDLLDNTGVHPESYAAARALLALTGVDGRDLTAGVPELDALVSARGAGDCAAACGVGLPTLLDIVAELRKPGRDPRDALPPALLRTDVLDMKDLRPGMVLEGTVRNVVDFGAFVDIGVHQDGLVHISQICDRYIRHPSEALQVGDVVRAVILAVEPEKKRISLSLRQRP